MRGGGQAAIAICGARRADASVSGVVGDGSGSVYFADDVVAPVGDKHISGGVDREAGGLIELSASGGSAVAIGLPGHTAISVSGDSGDVLSYGVNPANEIVAGIGDENIFVGVDRDAEGCVQEGVGGGAAVAAEITEEGIAATCDRGDDVRRRVDTANAIVKFVGDEEVAGGIQREARRKIDRGGRGGAAITGKAGDTGSGIGRDGAAGDFVDDVESRNGNESIARGIPDGGGRPGQDCGGSCAAIGAAAGDGVDGVWRLGLGGLGQKTGENDDDDKCHAAHANSSQFYESELPKWPNAFSSGEVEYRKWFIPNGFRERPQGLRGSMHASGQPRGWSCPHDISRIERDSGN